MSRLPRSWFTSESRTPESPIGRAFHPARRARYRAWARLNAGRCLSRSRYARVCGW